MTSMFLKACLFLAIRDYICCCSFPSYLDYKSEHGGVFIALARGGIILKLCLSPLVLVRGDFEQNTIVIYRSAKLVNRHGWRRIDAYRL